MTTSQRPYLFTHVTHVRIDDLNYGNHLCHSKFISLIHNTRALFLKKHQLSELNCYGYGIVMLHLEIDYRCQCVFDDLLEINLGIDKIDRAAFSFCYVIFNRTANKLAAKANTLMGFVDQKKGKLRRVPIEFSKLAKG